jgi:hypothetical protein
MNIIIVLWPVGFLILGLLIWVLAENPAKPKLSEAGKIMYACGLFWTIGVLAEHVLKL